MRFILTPYDNIKYLFSCNLNFDFIFFSYSLHFPTEFPDEPEEIRQCSETQRKRWQNRLRRLLHPH